LNSPPNRKFLFVCIASEEVGFGHLRRCITLARFFERKGGYTEFLVFGNQDAQLIVGDADYPCFFVPTNFKENDSCANQDVLQLVGGFDAIIADFSHNTFFSWANFVFDDGANTILENINGMVLALDSLGEISLIENYHDPNIQLRVVPYEVDECIPHESWRTLVGAKYAILPDSLNNFSESRVIRKIANRILVTCGGSDPTHLTIKILEGLELLETPVEVRVAIGPLFSQRLIRGIEEATISSTYKIELLYAPDDLIDSMLWCDLAVSTSGLTKYELAASGTPSILVSIDSFHERINQPFAKKGSSYSLGFEFTKEHLAGNVEYLLENQQKREAMADIGRSLVDGSGAERIFREIEEVINAEKTNQY
jgi:UDP-2,4-diacetamido-2,4,6-trideoxy-beta-L-altropyranose hydrolase